MPASYLRQILTLLLVLVLGTACTPGAATATVQPAAAAAQPATGTPAAPAPQKTREPKPAQGPKATPAANKVPEVFPTSVYVPDPAEFNLILGRPTASSITASLYARAAAQVTLRCGTAPGSYTARAGPVDLKANTPQTIELAGLAPNTRYFYQVSTNGVLSAEHTFVTQRAPGSSFSFAIEADPHNRDPHFSGELYARTLTAILGERPDFLIDLGDTFMTEKVEAKTYTEAESTFTDMRPYFGISGADVPLFLVNGNHEGELGWLLNGKADALALWSTRLRQATYPNPAPNAFYSGDTTPDPVLGGVRDGYYAWTWGDALFVVLDPFWNTTPKPQASDLQTNWNFTLGKEQYDWLKSTLETSPARFKFIFTHQLVGGIGDGRGGIEAAGLFEWGGNNADGTPGFAEQRPGWTLPIHQLLVENHVSAVFHGHDHVFVQQELDGIIYQELPQPSNANSSNTSLAAEYGYTHGTALGGSGHLLVSVTPAGARVDYIRSYLDRPAETAFSYTIP